MRRQDKMPARNKKNFRATKKGAGMTAAGVKAYRRLNPGSKLKRQGLRMGGAVCKIAKRGQNRDAIGKNS